jgi:two-component system, NarL family, invasion response regulator UvrY
MQNESFHMNILIVEDHSFFRSLIHNTLDAHFPSSEIMSFETSETAMSEIKNRHFDVAVIDISLPGENGLELTRKIRRISPDMKIIIYTQHNLPEYRDTAFEYGADQFLSKKEKNPKDLADLITTLTPP